MDADDLRQLIVREGVASFGGGNAPFLLVDPAQAWLVEAGRVDLFSVELVEGQAVGGRAYFCSIDAGQLLIGLPIERSGADHGLLAVGLLDTRLRAVPIARLRELAQDPACHASVAMLLDRWVAAVSAAVSRDTNPRTDVVLGPRAVETVPAGRRLRSLHGVQWLEAAGTDLLFVGMEEVPGVSRARLFPVTQDAWLQPMGPAVVTAHATADVVGEDGLWSGLEMFGETVCRCEAVNRRLTHVDEFNRTRDRLAGSRREVRAALVDLVGVLEKVSDEFDSPVTDPLFLCCHVVGRHQGIAVTPPSEMVRGEPIADPLDAIARASRIRTRRVSLDGRWWTSDSGPFVAFLADGHRPVAILPVSTDAYDVHDPQARTRRRVTEAVAASIEPFAHVLYRSFRDDAVTGWEVLKFGARGRTRDVARLLTVGAVGRILTMLPALAMGFLVDRIVPAGLVTDLVVLTLALVTVAVSAATFDLIRGFAVERLGGWMNHELQSAVIDRLLKLPITFFRGYTAGDLAHRAVGINQIRQNASLMIITLVLGNVFAVLDLGLLFYLDARLAIVACALVFIVLAISLALGLTNVRRQRRVAEEMGRVAGFVLQLFSGISKLRVAGAEMLAFATWARRFALQKQLAFDARRAANALAAVNAFFPVLIMAALFAMMASSSEDLSTGMFLAFVAALGSFVASTMAMTGALISTLNVVPMFERLRPILNTAPEVTHARPDPGVFVGRLELSRVTFRYSPETPIVLDDVTLHAQPGEFIAIVGPSGSGKSTLMRLLLGFERPMSGVVEYDGKDLWEFDLTAVRRQIGVVLQNSLLMPGDLFGNIAGARPLTTDDVWRAARLAGLEDEIRAMPMGLHTVIPPGGGGLSGGQRQRVLIARAMASQPRIVLLDEATSALDNRTQATVSASLDDLQATRIVIAHRLSTVVRADRIYVMESGKIVQTGTYDELMAAPGLFRDLATRQLAGGVAAG